MKFTDTDIDRIIKEAEAIGITDTKKVRNIYIRRRYEELRKTMGYWDAVNECMNEFYLSSFSIEKIITGTRKNG